MVNQPLGIPLDTVSRKCQTRCDLTSFPGEPNAPFSLAPPPPASQIFGSSLPHPQRRRRIQETKNEFRLPCPIFFRTGHKQLASISRRVLATFILGAILFPAHTPLHLHRKLHFPCKQHQPAPIHCVVSSYLCPFCGVRAKELRLLLQMEGCK
jgi:hypothetical protein